MKILNLCNVLWGLLSLFPPTELSEMHLFYTYLFSLPWSMCCILHACICRNSVKHKNTVKILSFFPMSMSVHNVYWAVQKNCCKTSYPVEVGCDHVMSTINWHSKAKKCGCKWLYEQSRDGCNVRAWLLTKLKMFGSWNGLLWLI